MALLPDTSVRVRKAEMLDDPTLDHATQRRALRGLERINAVSRVAGAMWEAIGALDPASWKQPVRVLDVATGAGDVPIGLWQRARKSNVPIEIAGCDKSREILIYARDRTRQQGADIRYFEHDVLTQDLPRDHDVLTCSLFLHHLSDDQAVHVLRSMAEAARRMIVVSDLERSPASYAMAAFACRLLTRCPIVHHDGPVSVRAAFTPDEALMLARRAGLDGVVVTKRFPKRWMLVWGKPG